MIYKLVKNIKRKRLLFAFVIFLVIQSPALLPCGRRPSLFIPWVRGSVSLPRWQLRRGHLSSSWTVALLQPGGGRMMLASPLRHLHPGLHSRDDLSWFCFAAVAMSQSFLLPGLPEQSALTPAWILSRILHSHWLTEPMSTLNKLPLFYSLKKTVITT